MNPDLPNFVISDILYAADLDIDTRRALKMRPKSVKRLIDVDVYSTLTKLFDLRSKMWNKFAKQGSNSALGGCLGPIIPQPDPRQTIEIDLTVWFIKGRVLMQIEKMLMVPAGPGSFSGQAYNRGSVHCEVQTGRLVPRFIDSDTESDMEDADFGPWQI